MVSDQYLAGLFDGEGYIRIQTWEKPNSPHVRYQVKVGIGMAYRPIIEKFKDRFGGSLHLNDHSKRNPKHRPLFTWCATSQIAAHFLRMMLPHLIVKRKEAELALQMQHSIDEWKHKLWLGFGGMHPQRDEVFAYRKELAEKISALKRQSFPVVDYGPSASVDSH